MLALFEDLRTGREWRRLVRAFIEELSEAVPGRVRQVIALPSPDSRIYDSNVLVVLEEDTPELCMEVIKAASRAERKLNVEGVLSPLVVGPDDVDAVERFMSFKKTDEAPWDDLIRAFIEELSEAVPGRVRQVIALPSPDSRIYDSNVLVVLEEDTPELCMEVIKAASRAERKLNVEGVLSPLVVGPDDVDAVERFGVLSS